MEVPGEVVAHLGNLRRDEVAVVEEPLGCRGERLLHPGRLQEVLADLLEDALALVQLAEVRPRGPARPPRAVLAGQESRVLPQALVRQPLLERRVVLLSLPCGRARRDEK